MIKAMVGLGVAGSLLASSTAAAASAAPAPAPINPWAALASLAQGVPAATMCGGAAGAAQAPGGCVLPATEAPPPVAEVTQPLPPPAAVVAPVAVTAAGLSGVYPILAALALIAAAAGAYGFSKATGNVGGPNSPA